MSTRRKPRSNRQHILHFIFNGNLSRPANRIEVGLGLLLVGAFLIYLLRIGLPPIEPEIDPLGELTKRLEAVERVVESVPNTTALALKNQSRIEKLEKQCAALK